MQFSIGMELRKYRKSQIHLAVFFPCEQSWVIDSLTRTWLLTYWNSYIALIKGHSWAPWGFWLNLPVVFRSMDEWLLWWILGFEIRALLFASHEKQINILFCLSALPCVLRPITITDICVVALVLVPTHELCMQVYEILQKLLHRFHWIVPGYIMGGENRSKEKARLRKGMPLFLITVSSLQMWVLILQVKSV